MPRYLAFLRAINVGGHTVKMEELRVLFEALGFGGVETFIASGNVIFETASADAPTLEARIEARLREALGYEVATFLRTPVELAAVARHQPFSQAAMESAGALNVGFLSAPLGPGQEDDLARFETEIDDFRAHGREVYWRCELNQSGSKFNNMVFERAFKIRATWRGINTVRRLAAKYPPTNR